MVIPTRPLPKPVGLTPAPVQVPAPAPAKQGGIRRREAVPTFKHETVEIFGELGEVVSQIRTTYSPAVITRANDEKVNYGRLASGILALDLCLGGGLMHSRGSMIYGQKSAGKSTVASRFVAAAQRKHPDKYAVYVDIEGTFDKPWAQNQGVDLDRLLIVEPETGEMAVDMADALCRAQETSIVVTDSIAFITPMKEIQGSAEDSLPGIHARLMGNYLRRLNSSMLVERHRGHYPVILHLNQFRMSIGVMFGDPRVLPGGNALQFATTQQVEISNKEHTNVEKKEKGAPKAEKVEGEDRNAMVIFNEHSFKITKDKSGGRYKEGKFKLIRDESQGFPVGYIDQTNGIRNFGLAAGIIDGTPQSFKFRNDDYGFAGSFRGYPEFSKFLLENRERERQIVSDIVQHFRAKWGIT